MHAPRTLFDKVWQRHVVVDETDETPAVLYIDLHLIHEVTSPQAFNVLRERGLPVRRKDRTLATMDHSTPTTPVRRLADIDVVGPAAAWPGAPDDGQLQGIRVTAARFRQR